MHAGTQEADRACKICTGPYEAGLLLKLGHNLPLLLNLHGLLLRLLLLLLHGSHLLLMLLPCDAQTSAPMKE